MLGERNCDGFSLPDVYSRRGYSSELSKRRLIAKVSTSGGFERLKLYASFLSFNAPLGLCISGSSMSFGLLSLSCKGCPMYTATCEDDFLLFLKFVHLSRKNFKGFGNDFLVF